MNPEFQRNLWLELPPHRLVSMPAVLVLVFFGAWLAGGSVSFAGAAQTLIILLLMVWGSRLAADAVLGEVVNHTWDNQRMSAISPWDMTWGKLLGSTCFMWYGVVWCIAAFLGSPHGDVSQLVRLLLGGLQAQALAMVISMVLLRAEPANLRFQATVAQSISVILMIPFLYVTMIHRPDVIYWYGFTVGFDGFITVSQMLFIAWTVMGLYQIMRAELQYETRSLTWLFFMLFMVAYVAGFDRLQDFTSKAGMPTPAVTRLFVAFCTGIALTYICALIEPKSALRFSRWLMLMRSGRFTHGGRLAPAWAGALGVSIVLCLLTAVNIVGVKGMSAPLPQMPLAFLAAILLFLLRDLAVFYYLVLQGRSGHGGLAIPVYLIAAYFLVPVLMSSARLDPLLPILLPSGAGSPVLTMLAPLAEAVVALVFVLQRWRAMRVEGLESTATATH
ncbi:MAG: hypothetical protein WCF85_04855 [Rhodospirillaceae bacterium]